MYAIVDIAGQQMKVEEGQEIFVHQLEGEEGSVVEFSEVLLIDNDGNILIGTPLLKDAKVTATIIEHLRGDKVLVFKKKRRKGYQKLNGHRQYFSKIQIDEIAEKAGPSKKAAAKPKAEKKGDETKVAEAAKPEVTEVKEEPKVKVKPEAPEKKKAESKVKSEAKEKTESKTKAKAESKLKAKTEEKPKAKAEEKPKAKAEEKPKPKTPAKPKAEAKPKTEAKVKAEAKPKKTTEKKKEDKTDKESKE